jgi:DNA-binding NtrC family response regulator
LVEITLTLVDLFDKMNSIQSQLKQKTLITFVGTRDPYTDSLVENLERNGPILGLLTAERSFNRIILISQPALREKCMATNEAINRLFPHILIEKLEVDILDPISYPEILRELRRLIPLISELAGNDMLYINASSGTPQMHACWILLAASGEIPARIINIRDPKFIGKGKERIVELDFTSSEFPVIRSAFRPENDERNHKLDIEEVIRQMGFVADHPSMKRVIEMIGILAPIDRSILIVGETGTGKEITARLLHRFSKRAAGNFIAVNCGAIPKDLVESILFGHKKGSFTGAITDHPGKFREAHKGTLFLDELGELPETAQVKLLRVLQTGEIEPVGESKTVRVDVRVIAATNADLPKMIKEGRFREDLYHRAAKSVIRIPSLAERKTDIPKIALLVLDHINHQLKKSKRISPEALIKLQNYSWPGNVRELENVVENAAILSGKDVIGESDIELSSHVSSQTDQSLPDPYPGFSLEAYMGKMREALILRAIEISEGNLSKAARLLSITPQAVHKYYHTTQKSGK